MEHTLTDAPIIVTCRNAVSEGLGIKIRDQEVLLYSLTNKQLRRSMREMSSFDVKETLLVSRIGRYKGHVFSLAGITQI